MALTKSFIDMPVQLWAAASGIGGSGALVISLDFELHWGVRDIRPLDAAERERLLSARQLIPALLDLFEEFGIHATWATVGFLFAQSKQQLEAFTPKLKPEYRRPELDPYTEKVGENEVEDPFHFAPGLIREIAGRTGQEIASHSFSHFYCLEPGQTEAAFEADLASALAIAEESDYAIRSYVFPRNQVRTGCLPALERASVCYRGPEPSALNEPCDYHSQRRPSRRLGRLADAYWNLSGTKTHGWKRQATAVSIPASHYLSPYRPWLKPLDTLRRRRILESMKHAAQTGQVYHLWWHPEDFAMHVEHNLRFLRSLLVAFDELRSSYGMQSLSMTEASLRMRARA